MKEYLLDSHTLIWSIVDDTKKGCSTFQTASSLKYFRYRPHIRGF